MKKSFVAFGILLILLISCKTKTDDPNRILKSKVISMNIQHHGCFGGGKQLIEIKEENGVRVLTSSFNNGHELPKKRIEFNSSKEKILIELIEASKSLPDEYCTGHSSYEITTEKYKYKFEDQTCTLDDKLTELIE